MAKTIVGTGSVDTSDLLTFARKMAEAAEPNLGRAFGKALRASALPVVEEAKALASWSSRIPSTIRAGGGANKIVIRAGGKNAPHAAAFEHGGVPGKFRHPVFGNRQNWVDQQARPFLTPALQKNAENTGKLAREAVFGVLREAGFY